MNNFIQIENRAGKLKLNDSVHKESADQLIDELETLYGEKAVVSNMMIGDVVCSADNALERVDVEINSPGGSVFEGQRIFNALRGVSSRGVEVTTTVNGLAASMGSVILMAGDTRKMTNGSRIMIHEASTMAWGDAKHLKQQAELLEGISSEIAGIYSERTGGDVSEIRDMMKVETWMTAVQAKESGFIDTIIKNGKESDDVDNQLKPRSILTNKNQNKNMGLFKNENDIKDQFEAAQKENDELTELVEKCEAEAKQLSQDLATSQQSLESVSNELEQVKASNKEITAKLEESEAKQSDFDSKVEAAASAKVAELGIPEPVEAKDESDDLLVTRNEFNKMKPAQKSSFAISGGKIKPE